MFMRLFIPYMLAAGLFFLFSSCSCRRGSENASDNFPRLYPIVEKAKWGYINEKGEVIVKPSYDFAFDFKSGFGRVKKGNLFGFVNEKGEEVIPPTLHYAEDFSGEIAVVNTKKLSGADAEYGYGYLQEGWTFINRSGFIFAEDFTKVTPLDIVSGYAGALDKEGNWSLVKPEGEFLKAHTQKFTGATVSFGNGYFVAKDGKKTLVYDKDMQVIMSGDFDALGNFYDGLAKARKSNKIGYVNLKGEWIYETKIIEGKVTEYDLRDFQDGVAMLRKNDGKYNFIGADGKFLFSESFEANYGNLHHSKSGIVAVKRNNIPVLLTHKGEELFAMDEKSAKDGLTIHDWNDKVVVIGAFGRAYSAYELKSKKLIAKDYDRIEIIGNLLRLTSGGDNGKLYGFINARGEWVIEPRYQMVWDFQNGRWRVRKGNAEYFVDRSGNETEIQAESKKTLSVQRCDNEKFGFGFDRENIVIPCNFDYAEEFIGEWAMVNNGGDYEVNSGMYNNTEIIRGGKWAIINRKGSPVCDFKYDFIAPINDDLAWFNLGGNCERTVTLDTHDYGQSNHYTSNICEGGKWGVISVSGQIICPAQFDSLDAGEDADFKRAYFFAKKRDKWLMVNQKGVPAIEKEFDEKPEFDGTFIYFAENGKVGVMNTEGKVLVQPRFDALTSCGSKQETGLSVDVFKFRANGGYGFVTSKDSVLFPERFEDVESFRGGTAKVKKGEFWGSINAKGETVIPFEYLSIGQDLGGFVECSKTGRSGVTEFGLIDRNGKVILPCKEGISFPETFEYWLYFQFYRINKPAEKCYGAGLRVFEQSGRHGVVDKQGKVVFAAEYDAIFIREKSRTVHLIKDGKSALATTDGKVLTGFDFTDISEMSEEGIFMVEYGGLGYSDNHEEMPDDGKYSFIDRKGNRITPKLFAAASEFRGGIASVQPDEDLREYGYMDFSGNWVRKPGR